jgi:septum formation protein
MRDLTREQIGEYLAKINPLDKAGAYAAQEHGNTIIERVEGSYSNVVGLPVERLQATLQKLGVVVDPD